MHFRRFNIISYDLHLQKRNAFAILFLPLISLYILLATEEVTAEKKTRLNQAQIPQCNNHMQIYRLQLIACASLPFRIKTISNRNSYFSSIKTLVEYLYFCFWPMPMRILALSLNSFASSEILTQSLLWSLTWCAHSFIIFIYMHPIIQSTWFFRFFIHLSLHIRVCASDFLNTQLTPTPCSIDKLLIISTCFVWTIILFVFVCFIFAVRFKSIFILCSVAISSKWFNKKCSISKKLAEMCVNETEREVISGYFFFLYA